MSKMVIYNGGTKSYYGCSNPERLVKGQMYEVTSAQDLGYQTNYTLAGVSGYFNSVWFDDAQNVYMALSREVPVIGKKCVCSKVETVNGQIKLTEARTSTVQNAYLIGNNIYKVTTCNSVYIIQVG